MFRPDAREAKELANLRGSAVHAYLARAFAELQDLLVTQDEPHTVRRLQGQAQAFRRLLELVDPEAFSTNGKRGMDRGTVHRE